MKKIILIVLIITTLFLTSCTNNVILINPHTGMEEEVSYYGFFNQEAEREDVKYELSIISVVASVLLIETVVFSVILCGWFLYEPIEIKG